MRRFAPWLGVLAVTMGLTGQDAPQLPMFRATTDAVTVDVSVRRNRSVLTGLGASDFVLLDNGVRQQIADVSYGKLPIDVTVALDVSYSVTGSLLERLRRAVAQLTRDLGKEDRLKLILFNMRVNRSVDFTKDVAAVEKAILGARAGGGTTLLDAMSVALVSAMSPDRRQLVMFFTDGGDSNSTTTSAALTGIAQRTLATLTVVMPLGMPTTTSFMTSSPASSQPQRALVLPFLPAVRETGGSIIPAGGSADLTGVFRSVLDEFRSTYVLHFAPKGVERAGFHTIEVSVTRDGAVVQARRGYFGG